MSAVVDDRAAERVADINWRAGRLVQTGRAGAGVDLGGEGLEAVAHAPVRGAHAGERQRRHSPIGGEKRRDEAPPVGVGAVAVDKDQPRLAGFAPGQQLDLRAQHRDARALRRGGEGGLEPRRRRRSDARERRQGSGHLRRHVGVRRDGRSFVEGGGVGHVVTPNARLKDRKGGWVQGRVDQSPAAASAAACRSARASSENPSSEASNSARQFCSAPR